VGEEVEVLDGKTWRKSTVWKVTTSIKSPSSEEISTKFKPSDAARSWKRKDVRSVPQDDETHLDQKTKVFSFKIYPGISDDVRCLESDLGLTLKTGKGCTADFCSAGHPTRKAFPTSKAERHCDVCATGKIVKVASWQAQDDQYKRCFCKKCDWWCCQACEEEPGVDLLHIVKAVTGEARRNGMLPKDVITRAVVDGDVVSLDGEAVTAEQMLGGARVLLDTKGLTLCADAVVLRPATGSGWRVKRLSNGVRSTVALDKVGIVGDGEVSMAAKINELIVAAKHKAASMGGEAPTAVDVELTVYRGEQWPSTVPQTVEQQALNGMRRLANGNESSSSNGNWNVQRFRYALHTLTM
jgi:hypothetical protein